MTKTLYFLFTTILCIILTQLIIDNISLRKNIEIMKIEDHKPHLYLSWFGGKADGITNNAKPLANALAAMNNMPYSVNLYFDNGTYIINPPQK